MADVKQLSFRTLVVWFSLGGIALLVLFIAIFVLIAISGGPDLFIAAAPIFFPLYELVAAIYVGFFMATLANNIGKSTWLWGMLGLFATAALYYLGESYFIPLAFFGPILSALVLGVILSIARARSTRV